MSKTCHLDFETGSELDLTQVGVYVYAAHPSTRVHVLQYTFDEGRTMRTWRVHLGEPMPADLDAALDDPTVLFAGWNVSFERIIFRDVLNIEIPIRRFRCSMAAARSMALPGSLALCARAIAAEVQKGDDAAMRRWMKPHDGVWASDLEDYKALCDYCALDVLTEIAIGLDLRQLSDEELEDYYLTETINDRGIPIDIELAHAAQRYAEAELQDIKRTLNILTKGRVTSPRQFIRIKAWLNDYLPDDLKLEPDDKGKITFDRAVREELLAVDNEDLITGEIREFIQLIHDGGRASTAKFLAMQQRAGADDRVRGAYVFNGAGQTNRFSSSGLQVHNFVRKKLPDIESVVEAIVAGVSPEELIRIASYDKAGALVVEPGESDPIRRPYDVMTILSRCLRPSIVAENGKTLVWGDWEQIEARMLPWLSGQNSASSLLDLFASGEDVYRHQAAATFHVPIDQVTPQMRQVGGKIPVLSFGFGGGAGAVLGMARNFGVAMTRDEAERLKNSWRTTNPWAQRFWMQLEAAAYNAVRHPGEEFTAGRVTYGVGFNTLWALLPSGRLLAYPHPAIEEVEGRFGMQSVVTCMKGSFHPKKGEVRWPRMKLWGGFQAENCIDSRSELLTSSGWKPILAVQSTDLLWDGCEWISHRGVVSKGTQEVIDFGGVGITPDHLIMTPRGWISAIRTTYEEAAAGEGFNWPTFWPVNGSALCRSYVRSSQGDLVGEMRLRHDQGSGRSRFKQGNDPQLWLFTRRNTDIDQNDTRYGQSSGVLGVALDARSLSSAVASGLCTLRRSWHQGVQALEQIRKLLDRHGRDLRTWFDTRSTGQLQRLQSGELCVAYLAGTGSQYTQKYHYRYASRQNADDGCRRPQWSATFTSGVPHRRGMACPQTVRQAEVFDIMNAGPRHCFTIRGDDGRPFIVHNCTQAEAASLLRYACRELERNGWPTIGHTHDEVLLEVPEEEADEAKAALHDIMTNVPNYWAGLPLAAEVKVGRVYGK